MASPERNFRRIAVAFVIGVSCLAAAAVAVAVADPEEAEVPPRAAPLPAWLHAVYPAPGAEMSSVSVVEVDYRAAGRRSVRLWIDGVDVTLYARPGEGQLHYDSDGERAPVTLEAGEHEAVAQLVRLPSFGDKHLLIDEFRWTFEVL